MRKSGDYEWNFYGRKRKSSLRLQFSLPQFAQTLESSQKPTEFVTWLDIN
jgi:hypothetical protein